jgi:2-polyprenyl-6-methoxyphenol hydroxylase-like FAD-dependent oxidoreductase
MPVLGDHAVVCGAGIAGLLAARVLAEHYRQVTIIERDVLSTEPTARRGVPQGPHAHGVLLRGADVMFGELCPGLLDELMADGAVSADLMEQAVYCQGHNILAIPTGYQLVLATRPFLENHLRSWVCELPGVVMRDGLKVADLVTSGGRGDKVVGVRTVMSGSASPIETIKADLVVDATGRTGRGAAWLAKLGHRRPDEQRLQIGVRYTSRYYRMPLDVFGSVRMVLISPRPGLPRGMSLAAQENGCWILSLAEYGDRPGVGAEAILDGVHELAPAEVSAAMRAAEPLGDVATYRFPANRRLRYERLHHHPDGLLTVGDSLCSLNPIYGAGITIAAEQALALRDCLRRGPVRDLPRSFYRSAARVTSRAWLMTSNADHAVNPGTHTRATAYFTRYLRRIAAAASQDPVVATALVRTMGQVAHPLELARPTVVARTLLRGSGRSASSGGSDVWDRRVGQLR